ncbi:MAG: hypothetical protein CMJ62_01990 [Planctomycetaceae bacterium]|nr:hypothetical protein [Planctomycetaceae bacterium]
MFPSGNTRAVLVAHRLVVFTTNPCSSFTLTTMFTVRGLFAFGGRIIDRIWQGQITILLLTRTTFFFTPLFLLSFFNKVLQFFWYC